MSGPHPSPTLDAVSAHRPMLFGLAYRLLGSVHDAEDVLQEAYLRWATVDQTTVAEPRRYLARVVTRLALDALRARQARRESYPGTWLPEPLPTPNPLAPAPPESDPVAAVTATESLSLALLHLLERLTPAERAVFVLRSAFGWPFGEIAETLDRTPAHCRQLYHRAAQALGHGRARRFPVDPQAQERLLAGFLAAVREGDFTRLTTLLYEDVVCWSDGGGRARAARRPVRGADRVIRFSLGVYGRTGPVRRLERRWLNGLPALVFVTDPTVYVLLAHSDGVRIHDLYLISNPDKLNALQVR